MRDFLYVSERKVDRMAPTLPPRVAQRLKELRFNAGPVGAGVVLADRRAETAVAAVIEVEQVIYDEFRVRDVVDPELAAGDWFSGDVMEMAYGVQVMNPEPGTGAAIFSAKIANLRLLLSGSAEYLLDRSVPRADAGEAMSDPQAIMTMLGSVTEDSGPHDSAHTSDDFARDAAYAAANLHSGFARFGLQPLKFLARTISVTESEWDPGTTLILGTPLFVEFATRG
jgi:Family of unknown function (DUF7019)